MRRRGFYKKDRGSSRSNAHRVEGTSLVPLTVVVAQTMTSPRSFGKNSCGTGPKLVPRFPRKTTGTRVHEAWDPDICHSIAIAALSELL